MIRLLPDGGFVVTMEGREPVEVKSWKDAAMRYSWALTQLEEYDKFNEEMRALREVFVQETRNARQMSEHCKQIGERKNHWGWAGVLTGYENAARAVFGADFWTADEESDHGDTNSEVADQSGSTGVHGD